MGYVSTETTSLSMREGARRMERMYTVLPSIGRAQATDVESLSDGKVLPVKVRSNSNSDKSLTRAAQLMLSLTSAPRHHWATNICPLPENQKDTSV